MLDFVPNHMGLDHPWIEDHPEYFISRHRTRPRPRSAELHLGQTQARRSAVGLRPRSVLSRLARHAAAQLRQPGHARSDDRRAGEDRRAMRRRALRHGHAGLARSVRTNLGPARAARSGRRRRSECASKSRAFVFMAEVYWDLEWTLQQQGFDYTYDKRLYDRLRDGHARPVREHLYAGLDYQDKMARFLENHDEPRAAATFSPDIHEAAAVITFFSPGLRFFHQGQFEGRTKRISPHLGRGPDEPVNEQLQEFYDAAACDPASALGSRWPVAIVGMCAGVGRKLDLGLLFGVCLAGKGRRTAARGRQLCTQPKPMLCASSVHRFGWYAMAAAGPAWRRSLRPRRK